MAGGITILLLIIVLLVVGGIALGLYGTGGVLWSRKTDPRRDRIADVTEEPADERARRPQHARPRTTARQRTDFAGREPHPHG